MHLQPKSLAYGMKSVTQMFGTLTALDVEALPAQVAAVAVAQNGATPEGPSVISISSVPGGDEVDSAAAGVSAPAAKEPEKEKPSRAARLWSRAAGVAHPTKRLQRILSTPSPPPGSLPAALTEERRMSVGGGTPTDKRMDLGDVVRKVKPLLFY